MPSSLYMCFKRSFCSFFNASIDFTNSFQLFAMLVPFTLFTSNLDACLSTFAISKSLFSTSFFLSQQLREFFYFFRSKVVIYYLEMLCRNTVAFFVAVCIGNVTPRFVMFCNRNFTVTALLDTTP